MYNKNQINKIARKYIKQLTGKSLIFGIRLKDNIYKRHDGTVSIAITHSVHKSINIHFGGHFKKLDIKSQLSIIKHESCHVADIYLNGLDNVLKQNPTGHGKTFNELCDKIGCKHKLSIDYNQVILRNIKSRKTKFFISQKESKIW